MWHPIWFLMGCIYILGIKLWLFPLFVPQPLVQDVPVHFQMILSNPFFVFLSGWVDGIFRLLLFLCLWWHKPSWLTWFPGTVWLFCMCLFPPGTHTHFLGIFIVWLMCLFFDSCDWRILVGCMCTVCFVVDIFTSTLTVYIIMVPFHFPCTFFLNVLSSVSMSSVWFSPICAYVAFGAGCFNASVKSRADLIFPALDMNGIILSG